jgi:hypothetical protein
MFVRFQVLTAASMKVRVFWDIASCSPVVFNQGYRVPPGVREDILGGT